MEPFKVLLVYPNLMLVTQLPNNIALLAAVLKKQGCEVRLFDTTFYQTTDKTNDEMRVERMQVRKFNIKDVGLKVKKQNMYDDFKKVVREYNPDLIGVSVVDDTVVMGLSLIKQADCKNIPVVFGGVYATFNTEQLLKQKEVNIVCIGEGEEALAELSHSLKNNLPYDNIKNLWIKKNDGAVLKNPIRPPVDINSLPYEDFSIFGKKHIFRPMQGKMLATIPINFDRGCPYRCSFCAAPALLGLYKNNGSNYYRVKSTDRIYREMRYYVDRYPVSFFYFNSETFLTMPIKRLKEFAKMYSEFQLPFWCQTRIETIAEEKIKILKNMNCDRISIGLEHGNEEFRRKVLRKEFSNQQVLQAFKILNKYNIKASVNNMIGFPDETRKLTFDTIRLNRKLKADAVNGFVFQPYSGTELRRYSIEKGYLPDGKELINSRSGTPIGSSVLNMPQFTRDKIEGILRTFSLYVRMPESCFPKIRKAEQLNKNGDVALEELKEIFFREYFK